MGVRKPRIILYGHFGSGNIGNDSSLEAMLHAIKEYRPHARVLCICNGPAVIRERFGIEALEIAPSRQENDNLSDSRIVARLQKTAKRVFSEIRFWIKRPAWFQKGDQFIVVGTGAVDDMAVKNPWNAPYDLYKWCSLAKWGGAQVVFLSVGVGPIVNRISRFLMLKALRTADYRSYRETAAFGYLEQIGYDTTGDKLYPDLVFSLPVESLPVSQPSVSAITVGLGLINYHGWRHDPVHGEKIYQDYLTKIKCFVAWLLDAGYFVRLISGDAIDQRPVQEVSEFVAREKSSHQHQLIVEPVSDVNELFAQIAKMDIVVASRFHNVLCSLMMARPVISLGYHEKNNALMKDMDLESYCQHIESFTVEKLVEHFNCHLSNLDRSTNRIQQRQQEYRQALDEQYRNIFLPKKQATLSQIRASRSI